MVVPIDPMLAEKEKIVEENNRETSEEEDYLYVSSEEEDIEKDYFGESEDESSSEDGAWEDSESGEEFLRGRHKSTATWINNKKVKKEIEVRKKSLSYNFNRFVFKTNFNIKIMKKCLSYLVLVDTMNNIYLLQEDQLVKSLRVEKFKIDDIVAFNENIYLINSRCGYLKEINPKLCVDNVEKTFVRNMRKAFASEFLYIMGDTTIVVNKHLNCIREYHDKLISMIEFRERIYAINSTGDVLVFSKELVLEKKVVFDEGVSFLELYSTPTHLVINSSNSIILLNDDLQIVKDIPHLKNPVQNIVYTEEHLFCFSTAQGGLKIIDPHLNFNNSFPRKKISLPKASIVTSYDNRIYLSSHRDLFVLTVNYK